MVRRKTTGLVLIGSELARQPFRGLLDEAMTAGSASSSLAPWRRRAAILNASAG